MKTDPKNSKGQQLTSSKRIEKANPFTGSDALCGIIECYASDEGKLSRRQGRKENDNGKELKIWQKGRSGAMVEKSRAAWIKDFLEDTKLGEKINETMANTIKVESKSKADEMVERLEKYLDGKDKREKKESLADFMAKKKEIFILQMSLNTKKEEIRKLNEKSRIKEEALKRSEKLLEEDASRFDVFLKDNDKKAQDALRTAEKETKKKIQKTQEIKKLNQQLQIVQSNIGKNKDNLEECQKLKIFLCQLTPSQWFDEQKKQKRERQSKRRTERIEEKRSMWRREQDRRVVEEQARQEAQISCNRKKRGQRKTQIKKASILSNNVPDLPVEPSFEDEVLTSSDEDIPMPFSRPHELLDIFSTLEEENLFLIQNMQEAEQSLEEVTSHFNVEKGIMQQKGSKLQENIQSIKQNILVGKHNITITEERVEGKYKGTQKKDQDTLDELGGKVKEIYQLCGFNDAGSSPSTLCMLSEIEASMDNILNRLEDMPIKKFREAEKMKEKKRRENKRTQQQARQTKIQEERNRKAIERSMQPPKRRVGRPVSF